MMAVVNKHADMKDAERAHHRHKDRHEPADRPRHIGRREIEIGGGRRGWHGWRERERVREREREVVPTFGSRELRHCVGGATKLPCGRAGEGHELHHNNGVGERFSVRE